MGAAILREIEPGKFDFAHPVMRSVVYRGLSPTTRLELHHQFALALKAILPEIAETQPIEIRVSTLLHRVT